MRLTEKTYGHMATTRKEDSSYPHVRISQQDCGDTPTRRAVPWSCVPQKLPRPQLVILSNYRTIEEHSYQITTQSKAKPEHLEEYDDDLKHWAHRTQSTGTSGTISCVPQLLRSRDYRNHNIR